MSTSPPESAALFEPRIKHERRAARVVLNMRPVCRSLNCGRWKVYDLIKNDPDFPNPRDIAGKLSWFEDEIEEYKSSRPRRQYAMAQANGDR